jgi:hypothetical protein
MTNLYYVSPVFISQNGVKLQYETNPRFIFVNKNGSELFVIKNLKESLHLDYWTIETIKLNKAI